MKKGKKTGLSLVLLLVLTFAFGITAQAKEENTIKTGIYADGIELSGMTAGQAEAAISAYVEELEAVPITLEAGGNNEVEVTAGDLGIQWVNPDLVEEAMELGRHGNVIQRYKALKDLEHENHIFKIEFSFDLQAISDVLTEKCAKYDQKAVNASLKRVDGKFQVVDGQTGYMLDVESSIDSVNNYLTLEWNHEPCSIPLDIETEEPKGSAEELAAVQDVLGSYTTAYTNSGAGRAANVDNASRLINGTTLYPGEEFSAHDAISPITSENGYYMAGSYLNGKVVDSVGGGVCQVSTTLYNAVLLSELEVTERFNHSMTVSYVEPSEDAALAQSAGKDFKFVNNTDYPIYIEAYTQNKKVTFNIYGKETRPAGRTLRFESEIVQVIPPSADQIYVDASQPIGYIVSDSAYTGYKAKLWKIVMENGVEVSRTQVNTSNYKMVPKSATVGTATADPAAYEEIMAAIGTGSVDHVKNVIAILTAQAAENSVEVGEQ